MSGINQDKRIRHTTRLSPELARMLQYWSSKGDYDSASDYIAQAVQEKIERENQDYDLPTLEIARLNQLVDVSKGIETNLGSLERVVLALSDTVIGLTRGDNYLAKDDDGELAS